VNEQDAVERTLSLARAALSPPAGESARVRAALGPTPWLGELAPSAPLPSAEGHAPLPGVWLGARAASLLAAAVIAALGASFASGYRLGQDRAAGAQAPLPAALVPAAAERSPAPSATLPPLPTVREQLPARSAAAERAPAQIERRAPKPPSRAVAASEALRPDELALLRRVERALRSGEPALALALLAELDERFPNSSLGEERRASNALAHCQLGDPGAAERAVSFLREHGSSVYADHVRFTCGLPTTAPR